MITRFIEYIVESRESIEELEMLNPEELGKLLIAEVRKASPDVQFMQDILIVGCPVDARDQYDRTALHWASYDGNFEVVKFLISRGADIQAKDERNWTPLHFAASYNHLKIAKFLVSKGVEVNAISIHDWTPLHSAAWNGHLRIVRFLVSRGGDIRIRNDGGWTPLHAAVLNAKYLEHTEIAKYLIKIGAPLDVMDLKGDTPWDSASYDTRRAIPELNPNK